jgi:hypothetical protein
MSNKTKIKRVVHISLRVTQAERDGLEHRAAGRSLSEYIRGMVLEEPLPPRLSQAEYQSLSLLNQLSEKVGDFSLHVRAAGSLRGRHVVDFLSAVERDLDAIRLGLLETGIENGHL